MSQLGSQPPGSLPPGSLPPDDENDPFWVRLRGGLDAQAAVPAPAPRDPAQLAGALLQRRQWEISAGRRTWRVIQMAGVAVVAACVGLAVGWQFRPDVRPAIQGPIAVVPVQVPVVATAAEPQPAAWFEDGGPAMAPAHDVGWASYMPRGSGDPAQASSAADRPHPWLGIWTRPIQQITVTGGSQSAHLVVRVAGGSPAWNAGLRPGDILTALDGCSLATPDCIGAHLSSLAPGTVVNATWWDGQAHRERCARITLDAIHE